MGTTGPKKDESKTNTDCNAALASFNRGQRVRIVNRDIGIKRLHVVESCRWNPMMENCVGLVGVVSRRTTAGHWRVVIFVKSEDGKVSQRKFAWHSVCLSPCTEYHFLQGMFVYICDDHEILLRQNGSWNRADGKCIQAAGKTGQVWEESSFGDTMISLDGKSSNLGISQSSLIPIYDSRVTDDKEFSSQFRTGRYGDPHIMDCIPELSGTSSAPTREQMEIFLEAARDGNQKIVGEFIYKFPGHIDDHVQPQMSTALMQAAYGGQNNVIHILCLAGASVMERDASGMIPLHYAVRGKHATSISVLIGYGRESLRATAEDGSTPLHLAVGKNVLDCFKVLVDQPETKVNAVLHLSGEGVFHACIQKERTEMLDYLLQKRRDIDCDIVNARYFNILHWAALHGNVKAVEYCMEKSPELINVQRSDGMSALHYAAQNGHGQVVEILIARGQALVDLVDSQGASPLLYALRCWRTHTSNLVGRLSAIWVLIKAGADVSIKGFQEEVTPLHEAMKTLEWMMEGGKEFPASLVVELQSMEWAEMHDMGTLVQRCREHYQLAVVLFLLANGANLNAKDKAGQKPTDLFRDLRFQYLWKHFNDTFQYNIGKRNLTGVNPVCAKCGRPADVIFDPCGHKHCCRHCARVMSFRFCACCNAPIKKMTTIEGEVINPVPVGGDVVEENLALRRRLEEAENAVLCVVCMDRKCNMFFNCGHMVCNECGKVEKLHVCPTCRIPIKKRHIVFPNW